MLFSSDLPSSMMLMLVMSEGIQLLSDGSFEPFKFFRREDLVSQTRIPQTDTSQMDQFGKIL
jgi:hypothetical protein